MAWWRRSEYARTVVFVLLLTVGAWELAVRMFGIRTFLLPPPSLVAMEILNNPGFYAFQSLYTIYITAIGFALAVIFGIGLAIAIVSSKFLDRTLYTLLIASNSVPKVALAPIFVIWLGTGGEPKVAIAGLIAVFPHRDQHHARDARGGSRHDRPGALGARAEPRRDAEDPPA